MTAMQEYENHVANCKQCGGEDEFENMCEEGYRLLQIVLPPNPNQTEVSMDTTAKKIATIKRLTNSVKITATHPDLLRVIIFAIADVTWPTWYLEPEGRQKYLEYADYAIEKGVLTCADRGFFDTAEPFLLKLLDLYAVTVCYEPQESIANPGLRDFVRTADSE